MIEKEIEKVLAEIRASFAFEGMELTEEDESGCRAILCGEATANDLLAKIIKPL